jgi:hypothetical protein
MKNIEKNRISDNILALLTYKDGKVGKLYSSPSNVIDVARLDLIKLEMIQTFDSVYCENNLLTELEVPDGTSTLWCHGNKLTSLEVPDTIEWLLCDKELFDYDSCNVEVAVIIY